ncbi:HEAT repeat domain-containing protein [uncultured Thiodictyon sp.]|jgi:HEAT repeat protein|uniref:HEAT repeat domain-containing protein n=1 Tax=uncultured Thiodictyon sp. TaxID=1846217 RepID=UPI0025D7F522|nr:HEAT repeat domain-containing protein [uncultured Thiodictyon sp.]
MSIFSKLFGNPDDPRALLRKAKKSERHGDRLAALKLYKDILERFPTSLEARQAKTEEIEIAKQLVKNLTYRSQVAATLAAEIDRFEEANPILAALGDAWGGIGLGRSEQTFAALDRLSEKKRELKQECERECRIRAEAALKLGELHYPFVVEPLITALKDKYREVRSNAASALGSIGDKRAVEPLTRLTQEDFEKNQGVREVALQALEAVKKLEKEPGNVGKSEALSTN